MHSSPMIKAIIFDICGVLFLPRDESHQGKHPLNSFGQACVLLRNYGINVTDEAKPLLREIYLKSSVGAITREETLSQMSAVVKSSPGDLERAFKKMYTDTSIENVELYEHVLDLKRRGYKIGILSLLFPLSKDIFIPQKYYDNFDALVVSCDDKLRKPDPRVFQLMLERLGASAHESVFVDDKKENVQASQALGMHGIRFESNDQLLEALAEVGVK